MAAFVDYIQTTAPDRLLSALSDADRQWLEENFRLIQELLLPTKQFHVSAQAVPSMKVEVSSGVLPLSNSFLVRAAQTSGIISAPSSNLRIDCVVVDKTTGNVSITTGTESATPSAPSIVNGVNKIAEIHLAPTTTKIVDTMIVAVKQPYLVG